MAHRLLLNQAFFLVVGVVGGLVYLLMQGPSAEDVVLDAVISVPIGAATSMWILRRISDRARVVPLPVGTRLASAWLTGALGVLGAVFPFAVAIGVTAAFGNGANVDGIAFLIGFAAGTAPAVLRTARYEREHPDRVLVTRVRPWGRNPTWAAPRA